MADQLGDLRTALRDRYEIVREIGEGGMATVYLAHDVRHGRQVAVKVLRADLSSGMGAERFVREIRLAARLTHPHILPLFDSGEAGGFLYFVMPVVEGQSLRDRIRQAKQLPADEATQVAMEVADALDYAHRHDVVHRDIKPENIMLHDGHAVVTDFGIGKAITAAVESASALTQTGVTVGTPAYMAPEQAAGEEDIDGRSDLYSLGCVCYEMLTGEQPFTGATAGAVIAKRFSQTPRPVSDVRDGIPVSLSQIGCSPARRPTDMPRVPMSFRRSSPERRGPRRSWTLTTNPLACFRSPICRRIRRTNSSPTASRRRSSTRSRNSRSSGSPRGRRRSPSKTSAAIWRTSPRSSKSRMSWRGASERRGTVSESRPNS